jgi:hypothetical protein
MGSRDIRCGSVAHAAALAVMLVACGDDAEAGMRDAAAIDSGTLAIDSSAPATRLPDNTAGKACDEDSDCGSGTCAAEIIGAAAGGALLPAPSGYCSAHCNTAVDCGAGGLCQDELADLDVSDSQCYAACTDDDDCREGYVCGGLPVLARTCRPAPHADQLEDHVAGDMCSADADCPGGACSMLRPGIAGIGELVLPGGYCTGNCLEDQHCGEGGVCSPPLNGAAGSCYQSCGTDADCTREGYRCRPIGGGRRGCNPAPDPLPDDAAGKACSDDDDCGGGQGSCASQLPGPGFAGVLEPVTAPGGYCSASCIEHVDCGAAGHCVREGRRGGRCFMACTAESDCREGYTCEARGTQDGAAGEGSATSNQVCVPARAEEPDAG